MTCASLPPDVPKARFSASQDVLARLDRSQVLCIRRSVRRAAVALPIDQLILILMLIRFFLVSPCFWPHNSFFYYQSPPHQESGSVQVHTFSPKVLNSLMLLALALATTGPLSSATENPRTLVGYSSKQTVSPGLCVPAIFAQQVISFSGWLAGVSCFWPSEIHLTDRVQRHDRMRA